MDEKKRKLTPEEEAAELAKPGNHPEWEIDLPAAIQKDIDAYLEGIRTQSSVLDCLWDELYGSINASQWGWEITKEQADYLRQKYLFEPEDEENRKNSSKPHNKDTRPLPGKTRQRFFVPSSSPDWEAPCWPPFGPVCRFRTQGGEWTRSRPPRPEFGPARSEFGKAPILHPRKGCEREAG